jgi:hypothetical protein
MWWTTAEHRVYAVDDFLGVIGIGLRLGSAISSVAATTRIDLTYNFGGDLDRADAS